MLPFQSVKLHAYEKGSSKFFKMDSSSDKLIRGLLKRGKEIKIYSF